MGQTSASFLASFIRPWLRRYEPHIDLTASLLSSTVALLFYYTVMPPILALSGSMGALRRIMRNGKTSLRKAYRMLQGDESRRSASVEGSVKPRIVIDLTDEDSSRAAFGAPGPAQVLSRSAKSDAEARSVRKTPRVAMTAPPIVIEDSPTEPSRSTPTHTAGPRAALLTPPQSPKQAKAAPMTLRVPTLAPAPRRSPRRHAGNRASPFSVDDEGDPEQSAPSHPVRQDRPVATKKTTRDLMAALDALPQPPSKLPSVDTDVFLVPPNRYDRQPRPGASRKPEVPARNPPRAPASKSGATAATHKRKATAEIAPESKKQAVAPAKRQIPSSGAAGPAAARASTTGRTSTVSAAPPTRPTATRRSAQITGDDVRSSLVGATATTRTGKTKVSTSGTGPAATKAAGTDEAPIKRPTAPSRTEKGSGGSTSVSIAQAGLQAGRPTKPAIAEKGSASVTVTGTKRKTSTMGAPSKRIKRDE